VQAGLIISGAVGRLNRVKMSEVLDVLVAILRTGGLER
jgi:hypothetical protein